MELNKPSICWRCAKATNELLCIWVATLEQMPNGVKLDNSGTICECPNFEKEVKNDLNYLTKRERAKLLGISERKFYSIQQRLRKQGRNITVEQYLNKGGRKMQLAQNYQQKLSDIKFILGLTQKEIADIIGTSRQNISKWAKGIYIPSEYFANRIDELYKIALKNER